MLFCKKLLPRRPLDYICSAIILFYVPAYFYFLIMHILPACHAPGGFWYAFHCILATFIFVNTMFNYMFCVLIDTSFAANSTNFTATQDQKDSTANWHYCVACKERAPPRSWHCYDCGSCILKRDHHCFFTGCCIGHYNHRYFLVFVVFLVLGTLYGFIYNSIYIFVLNDYKYLSHLTLMKLIFPHLFFLHGTAWDNTLLILYSFNTFYMIYGISFITYNTRTILCGGVSHEHKKNEYLYNYGEAENLKNVFGQRKHIVWLWPFIKSELPHDGIHWQMVKED